MSQPEFTVSVHHGEHQTLWYVIRKVTTSWEDWEVIATYHDPETARQWCESCIAAPGHSGDRLA